MEDQPIINQSIEMNTETIKSVTITEEDKERFFKCILADKPYEETVSLFDEQLRVKFRSMTVQENTDVVNQIVLDKEAGVAANNDAYMITISAYRLCLSMISIDDKPYSNINKDNYNPFTDNANDTYVSARAKIVRGWSTSKLAIFIDAFNVFEAKILKLTNEVRTPNFWKASA